MVILASEADGSLKVQVIDHGIGLGPRFDSPGMGLGLPLMSRLAESFEAQSSAGSGTEIRMNFKLRQPDVANQGIAPPSRRTSPAWWLSTPDGPDPA